VSSWDDEHMRRVLADADLSVTVRRWPDEDDDFDDGLSAVIAAVMRSGAVDYRTARTIVHALHDAGYID
jgi:hypothetical protein